VAGGREQAGPLEQAGEAHAAPALARVEAAGAVEPGHQRVAGLKLRQREAQRPGDQPARLEPIGVVRQRRGLSATQEVEGKALPSNEPAS